MLRLDQITDAQQLREVAELLESENRRLHARLALPRALAQLCLACHDVLRRGLTMRRLHAQ